MDQRYARRVEPEVETCANVEAAPTSASNADALAALFGAGTCPSPAAGPASALEPLWALLNDPAAAPMDRAAALVRYRDQRLAQSPWGAMTDIRENKPGRPLPGAWDGPPPEDRTLPEDRASLDADVAALLEDAGSTSSTACCGTTPTRSGPLAAPASQSATFPGRSPSCARTMSS